MTYEPNELTPEQLENIQKPIAGGAPEQSKHAEGDVITGSEVNNPDLYRSEKELERLQVLAEVNEKFGAVLEKGYPDPVERAEAKDMIVARIIAERHQKSAA